MKRAAAAAGELRQFRAGQPLAIAEEVYSRLTVLLDTEAILCFINTPPGAYLSL